MSTFVSLQREKKTQLNCLFIWLTMNFSVVSGPKSAFGATYKPDMYWDCTLGHRLPSARCQQACRYVSAQFVKKRHLIIQPRQVLGHKVAHSWSTVISLEAVWWLVKALGRTDWSREKKLEKDARRCSELFSAEVGSHWWYLSQVISRPDEGFRRVSLASPFNIHSTCI